MRRFRAATRTFAAAVACAAAVLAAAPAAGQRMAYVDGAAHRVLRIHATPQVAIEVLDWGGTGPALVFLSGSGATGHAFDTFAPRLTDRFRVIAISRRGMASSDKPENGPYDGATLAADVKAVLDSLGIARASLAGWSFGGIEASFFAAAYPEATEKLVYLDSYCSGCEGALPLRAGAYRPPPPPITRRDTLTARGLMAYQRRTLGFAFPEAELHQVVEYGDRTARGIVPAYASRGLHEARTRPELARVRAPALGIFAERSTVQAEFWYARRMTPEVRKLAQVYVDNAAATRRAAREQFLRQMPHARAEVIEGAHHAIFLSHPAETERLMRAFLLAPADTAR